VVGSDKSDEEDYLAGRTRQMAHSTFEDDFKKNDLPCGTKKTMVLLPLCFFFKVGQPALVFVIMFLGLMFGSWVFCLICKVEFCLDRLNQRYVQLDEGAVVDKDLAVEARWKLEWVFTSNNLGSAIRGCRRSREDHWV